MKSLYFSKFLEITGFTSAECILHLISTVDSFVHTLSEENSLDRSDLWVFHTSPASVEGADEGSVL